MTDNRRHWTFDKSISFGNALTLLVIIVAATGSFFSLESKASRLENEIDRAKEERKEIGIVIAKLSDALEKSNTTASQQLKMLYELRVLIEQRTK